MEVSTQRLTIDRINDRGCENVIVGMCRQMVKDLIKYRDRTISDPDDVDSFERYLKVSREFESERFHSLTGLDGHKVFERIEEVLNDPRGRPAIKQRG